jgi:hypothetical protein
VVGEPEVEPIEDDPEPILDLIALEDMDAAPTIMRTPTVWARQLVDQGDGTAVAKVYFGNDVENKQRGWCPSSAATACCKWRVVSQSETLIQYCASMYAWHQHHGADDGVVDRASHLEFSPPRARVDDAERHLRLRCF